ncbi:restriction endonuclease subunit S [Helicobacter pylori]|uniref:restriction endonuclease subunit S n=1 Tax=Helicobacter pylori TaxID=210 RepID=UPI000EB34164|nr:restriction endonuclease subunit S [Helicobacter pylori]
MIGPLSSQLNAIKWGEFSYETIYELQKTTKLLSKKDCVENGKIPLFTSDSKNNGIVGYVNCEPSYKLKNNQCMVVFGDHTRTFNIAKNDFCIADNVKVLKLIKNFSIRILLFINTMWGKKIIDKGYARHWSLAKIAKIQLPLKPTAKTQTLEDVDFDFMEKFIAELEQCRLAELEAYLKATGLENTTLSNEEENALNVFNGNNSNTPCGLTWQSFKLGDLFEMERGTRLTKANRIKGTRPLATAGYENYGVAEYISNHDQKVFKGNTITIDMFANAFYRYSEYSADDNILVLTPKFTMSYRIGLCVTARINAVLKAKFSYGKQYRQKDFNVTIISLPLKPTANTQTLDDIDFNFMHTLINALMKQTIQGVAQYCGAKIQATKEVISQETPIQKDSLF